jgi:cbb3-type cytochrome oxidase subunit 3
MKSFTRIIIPALIFILICNSAFSQKRKHRHDEDAVVTIKINGKEQDIEEYFEEWGEEFERKMERMFDDPQIRIRINEDDFDIDIDDICIDIGDFAESIAEMVEEAVTHMDIELHDLDPNDLDDDYDFDDEEDLEDLIDDIEDKYDSRVENIDRLKIKIREDYVKIELDATLENGKKVDKIKIYAH